MKIRFGETSWDIRPTDARQIGLAMLERGARTENTLLLELGNQIIEEPEP